MMRRIAGGIAVLIIIIIAAAAVAPYFVGRAAEANFRAQVAYANARYPNMVVHVDSYHRGFYRSDAVLSFSAGAGAAGDTAEHIWELMFGSNMTTTKVHMRINQGPIPFAAFGDGHVNFTPVLYTAEFRGEGASSLSLIGVLKPKVYVVQSFAGSTRSTLTVPPGKFGAGALAVTWQGGQATDTLNAARDRVHYSGEIKPIGFQYRDAKTGKSFSGTLKGFLLSGTKSKAAHDFWTGVDQITSRGAQFNQGDKPTLTLAGSDYRAQTEETPDGKWISGSAHLQQQGGQVLGWSWSNLDVQGALSKLDANGLRQAMEKLRAAQGGVGKEQESASLALLSSALPKAIKPETQGRLTLVLNAPDGNANIDLSGGFDAPVSASAAAALNDDELLSQRADWHMTLDFDRKLVDGFGLKVLGEPAVQSADQLLEAWTKQGYLQAGSAGRYHSLIVYRAGVLMINGRTVNKAGGTVQPAPGARSGG